MNYNYNSEEVWYYVWVGLSILCNVMLIALLFYCTRRCLKAPKKRRTAPAKQPAGWAPYDDKRTHVAAHPQVIYIQPRTYGLEPVYTHQAAATPAPVPAPVPVQPAPPVMPAQPAPQPVQAPVHAPVQAPVQAPVYAPAGLPPAPPSAAPGTPRRVMIESNNAQYMEALEAKEAENRALKDRLQWMEKLQSKREASQYERK